MSDRLLIALAERVEAAKVADREIDRAVWYELAETGAQPTADPVHAPAYTASLDAAMTLVPEGWWWSVGADGEGPYAQCARTTGPRTGFVNAATPALALCAAALRARATLPPSL